LYPTLPTTEKLEVSEAHTAAAIVVAEGIDIPEIYPEMVDNAPVVSATPFVSHPVIVVFVVPNAVASAVDQLVQ
jgi:hypothetical protein